jgi:[ribosomal protein S18]-alanine N-acetyltransferase
VSTEVWVRRMTEADVDAVMALASGLPTAPQWPLEAYWAVLNLEATPERIALVAETDAAGLVGFAIASVIAPEAELESIAVAEEFQRMGVAGRLFAGLTGELVSNGVTEVLLEVRGSNAGALSLYRVLGFSETGRRLAYYAHPIEDAVQLRLKIG